jgi:hypothetical protein
MHQLILAGQKSTEQETCVQQVAKQKTNSVASVRKRTIPTERQQLLGEVSGNFCR